MKHKKLLNALGLIAGATVAVVPIVGLVSCAPTGKTKIRLDSELLEISKGRYEFLTASLEPQGAGELLWETDKSGIITLEHGESQFQKKVVVSQTAQTKQEAKITVSLKNDPKVAPVMCKVRVLPEQIQWSAISKQGTISWQDNKIKAQLKSDKELTDELLATIEIKWNFSKDSKISSGQVYTYKWEKDESDNTIINIEADIKSDAIIAGEEDASFDIVISYKKETYTFKTTIDGFVWIYEESDEMIIDQTKPCHIYTNGKTLHIPFELKNPIEKTDRTKLTAKVELSNPTVKKGKDLFVWANDGESLTQGEYYYQFTGELPPEGDTINVRFTYEGANAFQQTFKGIQMDRVALSTVFDDSETPKTGTFGDSHTISLDIACTSHEVSEYVANWFETVTLFINWSDSSSIHSTDEKSITWNEEHTILTITLKFGSDERYWTESTHAKFQVKLKYNNYAVDEGEWLTKEFDYTYIKDK